MAVTRSSDQIPPPTPTPTSVDAVRPFESDAPSGERQFSRETQLSDPPTAIVHRDDVRELLPGTIVDDTYEVDARLGEGAMGEVYAARHLRLDKRVAIKVIGRRLSQDAAAIERFALEARALAQIQHPAIVAVEHVGELADGRAYFVMEFLRGEPLFEKLQRGRVPLQEALRVLDQMARGLEAAHAQGIIHRDLKPENVFLVHLPGELPIVKLVDFGLSKLTADRADDDRRAERTQSGVAIGTPMYMSPEQMRGQGVDHRTDIYALGCVAYELVLGTPPFPEACTAPELYASHLHASPPLPRSIWPDVPPQLDLCLFAMLAKDPAHRPTLAQVRSVIGAQEEPSRRAVTEYVGPRAQPTGWKSIAIAMFALVGGLLIGAALTERSSRDTHARVVPVVPSALASAPPVAPPLVAPPIPTRPPTRADVVSPPIKQRPRGVDKSTRVSVPRQPPKADVAPVATAAVTPPLDAGIDAEVQAPERTVPAPKPPIDKNQIVNPFAKRHEVKP